MRVERVSLEHLGSVATYSTHTCKTRIYRLYTHKHRHSHITISVRTYRQAGGQTQTQTHAPLNKQGTSCTLWPVATYPWRGMRPGCRQMAQEGAAVPMEREIGAGGLTRLPEDNGARRNTAGTAGERLVHRSRAGEGGRRLKSQPTLHKSRAAAGRNPVHSNSGHPRSQTIQSTRPHCGVCNQNLTGSRRLFIAFIHNYLSK